MLSPSLLPVRSFRNNDRGLSLCLGFRFGVCFSLSCSVSSLSLLACVMSATLFALLNIINYQLSFPECNFIIFCQPYLFYVLYE